MINGFKLIKKEETDTLSIVNFDNYNPNSYTSTRFIFEYQYPILSKYKGKKIKFSLHFLNDKKNSYHKTISIATSPKDIETFEFMKKNELGYSLLDKKFSRFIFKNNLFLGEPIADMRKFGYLGTEENMMVIDFNCKSIIKSQFQTFLKYLINEILDIEDDNFIELLVKSNFAQDSSKEEQEFLMKIEKLYLLNNEEKVDINELLKEARQIDVENGRQGFFVLQLAKSLQIFPNKAFFVIEEILNLDKEMIFSHEGMVIESFHALKAEIAFNIANKISDYKNSLIKEKKTLLNLISANQKSLVLDKVNKVIPQDREEDKFITKKINKLNLSIEEAKKDERKFLHAAFLNYMTSRNLLENIKPILSLIFYRYSYECNLKDLSPEEVKELEIQLNFDEPVEMIDTILQFGQIIAKKNNELKELEEFSQKLVKRCENNERLSKYELDIFLDVENQGLNTLNTINKLNNKRNVSTQTENISTQTVNISNQTVNIFNQTNTSNQTENAPTQTGDIFLDYFNSSKNAINQNSKSQDSLDENYLLDSNKIDFYRDFT